MSPVFSQHWSTLRHRRFNLFAECDVHVDQFLKQQSNCVIPVLFTHNLSSFFMFVNLHSSQRTAVHSGLRCDVGPSWKFITASLQWTLPIGRSNNRIHLKMSNQNALCWLGILSFYCCATAQKVVVFEQFHRRYSCYAIPSLLSLLPTTSALIGKLKEW